MTKPKVDRSVVLVRCFRFDPSIDREHQYQEYEVPIEFGVSVMNVLDYIYENMDGSIAYYSNCQRGICGRCAMLVDGRRVLACIEMVTGDLTLEPLPGHRVVRDLVVEGI
ncbi:MAG: 2Fe-2S iron-sulfur cluster-binding protein [Candidatus Hermodarchaeia archaeon]